MPARVKPGAGASALRAVDRGADQGAGRWSDGWRGGGGGGGDAVANLEVGVLGEEEPHVGVAPVLPLELRTRPPTRPWCQPCSHPRRSMERGLVLSLNGGTPLQGRAGILR